MVEEQQVTPTDTTDLKEESKKYFNKSKDFIFKYRDVFFILFLFSICIFIRAQSFNLDFTDDMAKQNIINSIRGQIQSQVQQQYPQLPEDKIQELVNAEFSNNIESNKEKFDESVKQFSSLLKMNFRDNAGQTYLTEMDTYFWMRIAGNILTTGHPQDDNINGKPRDTFMLAPNGKELPTINFHPYLISTSFLITRIFIPDISLLTVTFFIPILLICLAIIPAYFLAKSMTSSSFAGLISGMIVLTNQALLSRSIGGFSDTDPYEVLFPLFITWVLFMAYDKEKTWQYLLFAGLAGLLTGLFAFAWIGWAFIFYLICGTLGLYLIYLKFTKRILIRHLQISAVYVISTLVFVALLRGINIVYLGLLSPFWFLRLRNVAEGTIWPNVFTTVAEQGNVNINEIIGGIGGPILLVLMATGLIALFLDSGYKKHSILFGAWFAATFFASTKGFRYVLLMVPVIAILTAYAINTIRKQGSDKISKSIDMNAKHVDWIIIIGTVLLLGIFTNQALQHNDSVPNIDRGWVTTLENIAKNSTQEAIITSWWDFGHWFKYFGERRVTFDGASQHENGLIHWVGRILSTNDEHEAMSILRMIDCGGGKNTVTLLNNFTGDELESVNLLKQLIMMNKTDARTALKDYVIREDILQQTHCEPPQSIFITSGDMVGKSGVWAHFGFWDFKKARIVNLVDQKVGIDKLAKETNMTMEEASATIQKVSMMTHDERNYWIAPWPGYVSGPNKCNGLECTFSISGTSFMVNIDLENETLKASTMNVEHPFSSLVYMKDDSLRKVKFDNPKQPLAIMVTNQSDGYYATILSEELSDSVFTRLFYFGGEGLEHFSLRDTQRTARNEMIYVWDVKW